MTTTEAKSGKVIGQEYLGRIQNYLHSTAALPLLADGSLNMSAIATGANVPRQSLYKNPAIRSLLEAERTQRIVPKEQGPISEAASADVLPPRESKQAKLLERRVNQLEQQNAALVAENAELRRQLKALRLQMGREDMAIETGHRIPAAPGSHA